MKRGFTLIELLVVVAIIGLLSSIVLAGLTVARLRAQDSVTRQEGRQVKNALFIWQNEHGAFSGPSNADVPGYTDGTIVWKSDAGGSSNNFSQLMGKVGLANISCPKDCAYLYSAVTGPMFITALNYAPANNNQPAPESCNPFTGYDTSLGCGICIDLPGHAGSGGTGSNPGHYCTIPQDQCSDPSGAVALALRISSFYCEVASGNNFTDYCVAPDLCPDKN